MTRSIFRELLLLVAGGLAIWLFFSVVDVFPDEEDLHLSLTQEEKLGNMIVNTFLSTERQLHEPVVDSALEVIESRLLTELDSTPYQYTFYVIDSDAINAFATVGGHIVVFSGLLGFAESPEELAAVLAHEIGHVELGHVGDRLVKEAGISLLLTVLGGGDQAMITEITRSLVSAAYSRRQEFEADAFGHRMLVEAGISPDAYVSFFRRLDEEMSIDERLEFLMGHPHNKARIEDAGAYRLPEGFVERGLLVDWGDVSEIVK